eukprot:Selendium_serpulae@DN1967_c0_g1_i3.p1
MRIRLVTHHNTPFTFSIFRTTLLNTECCCRSLWAFPKSRYLSCASCWASPIPVRDNGDPLPSVTRSSRPSEAGSGVSIYFLKCKLLVESSIRKSIKRLDLSMTRPFFSSFASYQYRLEMYRSPAAMLS